MGGDLSAGDSLIVSVTVLGDLEGRAPVLRSGARPGDAVVHVGTLGRSAAGLALLSASSDCASGSGSVIPSGQEQPQAWACIEAFRAPVPPLAAGRELALAGATSMLDVSDGLLRDAGRIARASGVVIDLDDPGDLPDASFLEPVAALVSGVMDRPLTPWPAAGCSPGERTTDCSPPSRHTPLIGCPPAPG